VTIHWGSIIVGLLAGWLLSGVLSGAFRKVST
jgi:hypothetical protein